MARQWAAALRAAGVAGLVGGVSLLVAALPAAAAGDDGGPSGSDRPASAAPEPSASTAQATGTRTPADQSGPAGANGTIKVHDGSSRTTQPAEENDPHVGCSFSVEFFGFDAPDTGTVTISGQAPTGAGTEVFHLTGYQADGAGSRGPGNTADSILAFTVVSGGGDAGGTWQSGTQSYDLSLAKLGDAKTTPSHTLGWHVKASYASDNPPGGAKQKVFWIDCSPSTTGAAATQHQLVSPQPGTTAGGAGSGATPGVQVMAAATSRSAPAQKPADTTTAASQGTQVLGAQLRRGALPFTGAEVGWMAAAGIALVGGGAGVTMAARRRRRADGA